MNSSIFTIIIGKSGRGKSTAIRNLDPESTFLINVIGKTLPFPGGGKYVEGKNMLTTASAANIMAQLNACSKNLAIKTVVIDDLQYVMATDFMMRALEKGYDKFTTMAKNMWDLLLSCSKLRPGLKVFALAHEEETNSGERKMKTLGKLLDDKLTPEGLATIVLYSEVYTTESGPQYAFLTQSEGMASAKSPLGMFPLYIPNDLRMISDRIDEYYAGIPLEETKVGFDELKSKK